MTTPQILARLRRGNFVLMTFFMAGTVLMRPGRHADKTPRLPPRRSLMGPIHREHRRRALTRVILRIRKS